MAKKILLVDDETDIVTLVSSRLKASGYDVITAIDGMEALDKARKEKPELILLDVMLPKLDGFKVCHILKFDDNFKDIPIIMFTARAGEKDSKIAYESKADDYVTKPFEPTVLLSKVKNLLKEGDPIKPQK